MPAFADTFTYDDEPSSPIAFDDVDTVICNEPMTRTFTITDAFLVKDIDLGFNADHAYRSDIRLVLESPKGTRVEVVVEFDMTPEDGRKNYDILLDDDVTNPLDDGTADNTNTPYYERHVQPANPFTAFSNERAKGIWTLEICDAGVADGGVYQRSRLLFDGTPIADGPQPNTISGLLFRDYNADGRYKVRAEGGIPNITVTAYADDGAVVATATTDAAGEYLLSVPDGTAVRLEFDGLPDFLQPGPAGRDSATTVTFVTSPAAAVNVGLANPGQHAQNSNEMSIVLPRYVYGPSDGPNANMETLLSYPEDDGIHDLLSGEDADTTVYDGNSTILARQNQTGSIWGMAYDRLHGQLLGAALVKRHTGLGFTGNPTTIYRVDPDTQGATEWFTLDPNRLDPHGTNVDWVEDFAVYDAVGKEGWGDLDMSDDLRTLYGVDLGTRQLVIIPIRENGSAGAPTGIDILPALPADLIGGAEGQCPTPADLRPFGLGINDGIVYLGVVCTAESTVVVNALPIQAPTKDRDMGKPPGNFSKMRAYVFAWNGDVTTPLFTQVIDFPLRYPRGCASYNQQAGCEAKYPGEWLPWISAFPYSSDGTATPSGKTSFESFYPQALVSNIEFQNGSMVLFLMDRFGNQVGPFTQSPYGEELNHVAAHSDILFACRQGDSWIMEAAFSNDPSCDTGIRAYIRGEERADEYFGEDTYRARFALHGDVGFGAGVAIPGRETVIHAVFDPIYAMDGRADTLFDGGLHWYSVADGHWRKSIRIYNNITGVLPAEGIFSKANGLGDIVALTAIPPVEIGNRVWLDRNQDGIQSPSEPGIVGVMVELLCPAVGPDGIAGNGDDATVVAAAQTDDSGHYYFSSAIDNDSPSARYGLNLISATACIVRIPNAVGTAQQTALLGLQLTERADQTPTTSGNDQNDSDGLLVGASAVANFAIGAPGMNNHTYDFGFFADDPVVLHSLGNQVWFDANDNAAIDNGEVGAVGVALTLYGSDDSQLTTTTTTAGGLYLFDELPVGAYRVGVDASNFVPGGLFAGCRSSSEALDEDDPNLDIDNNDNGVVTAGVLRSALLTLGANEPLSESPDNDPTTPDDRENLTLDFGIFCSEPEPTHSLGNQVWFDANDNARIDNGEAGAVGVALTLYGSDDSQLTTTTTTAGGLYLFDELPVGAYRVGVDASNFAPGGIFEGCRSSSEALDEDDPNLDGDSNDNGVVTADILRSALLTLGANEPLSENPDNDPTTPDARENLTLDFGIFCSEPEPTHSLGNQVWFDANDNAAIDNGEVGAVGVALTLYGSDDTLLTTTTTTADGLYLFDELPAGAYRVGVDGGNFAPGGLFEGCRSSSEALDEDDPNLDIDNNDNGMVTAGDLHSALLTLGANEPLSESPDNDPTTPDDRENLTLDFGIFCSEPEPTHSLGNQVWFDANDNARIDNGEAGAVGVALTLYGSDDTLLTTTTTTADGLYLFDELPAGAYRVGVDVSNFVPGGLFEGCRSSSEALDEDDPNLDIDNNDNGMVTAGDLHSALLTLGANEPLSESPDNDPTTPDARENLTLDFGIFCSEPEPTHSLGNQVWFDANDNARIDNGEVGAVGVALTLYGSDDTLLTTTTTTADGLYLFDELPAGAYRVGVDASNFAPGGLFEGCRSSSEALDEDDPNLDIDNNDNGVVTAGVLRSALLTLGANEPLSESPDNDPSTPDDRENLTLDFGIFCSEPEPTHSLGNQVWFDANNNTHIDENEAGIDNVDLTLYATNGTTGMGDDTLVAQTTTANGGFYLFTDLPAGDYSIELDSANFGFDGVLRSCLSSNEAIDEDRPDLDQDNNDNGILLDNRIRSGIVQLGNNEPLGEEPDNDAFTADQRENLTVDFGCYLTVSLGNRIWIDDGRGGGQADNGLLDGSEQGVPGVILALLDGNKQPLLDTNGHLITTTTDLAGYYLFTDLLPGNYGVQVLPINFQDGGVLTGYSSSSSTEEDPNLDGDTNDNGIDNATPAVDGICSNVVTLTYTMEPGQEPDPGQLPDRSLDSNSNLTVDFGFVPQQPTTLDASPEPVEEHRLFLPWVRGV